MNEQVKIQELKVNYQVVGAGRPVIILHGWGSRADLWTPVQEKIASCGFKVIVPDLIGFGQSDPPLTGWRVDDYVSWFEDFIQKISERHQEFKEPFFLVGHSFGGRIAIKIAAGRSLSLKGLVLCGAAGLPPETSLKLRMLSGLAKSGSNLIKKMKLDWLHDSARDFYYRLLHQHDYLKVSRTMKDTFRLVVEEDLSGCLPAIETPTLIIWGEKDYIVPIEQAHRFHQAIKGSQLKIIKEIGHSPQLEAPEKLVELLQHFFQKSNG